MLVKVVDEGHFQVLSTNFSIGPSTTGYTLRFSADGKEFTDLFTVSAGTNRICNSMPNGAYYYLSGNQGTVTINWEKECHGGGGGGTAGVESINGQSGALNLKTVNGNQLLGTGDIEIEGGSGDYKIVSELPEEPIEGEMIYLTQEQTVTGEIPVIGDGLVFDIESLPSDYTHFAGVYRVEGGGGVKATWDGQTDYEKWDDEAEYFSGVDIIWTEDYDGNWGEDGNEWFYFQAHPSETPGYDIGATLYAQDYRVRAHRIGSDGGDDVWVENNESQIVSWIFDDGITRGFTLSLDDSGIHITNISESLCVAYFKGGEGGSRGSEDAYFYKDYDSNVKGFINWYGDFDLTADTWTKVGNPDMLEVVYKVEDGKVYIAMVTRRAVAEDTLLPGEGFTPEDTFNAYYGVLGIYKPGNYVYNGTDWVSKDIPSISVIGNEVLTEDKQTDFDKVIEAYLNKQPYIVIWEGKSCTIWGNNEAHTEFDAGYAYGQGSEIKSQGFTIRRNEASTIHTDLTLNIQAGFATRSGKSVEVPAADELIFDSANWFGNWEGNAIYDSNNEVLLWLEIWGTPRIGDGDFFDENKWHSFTRESSDTTIYARVEHYLDEVSGEERKKTYVRIVGENWTINPECEGFYTDAGTKPALAVGDTFKIMALAGWEEQDSNVRSIDLDFITLGGHKLDSQKLQALLALLEN